jgi:hypothetical protein
VDGRPRLASVAGLRRSGVQWCTNRLETVRRRAWPDCPSPAGTRVVAVVVSYNTVDLTRQMLYSVFASGVIRDLAEIVVVDNRSADGTLAYLTELDRRGLVTLIENRWPTYHGPGLNRAMSSLARRPDACSIGHVWILDSDVVVLRSDTVVDAVAVARTTGAALVGQKRHGVRALFSLLVDPRAVWRRGIPPFLESGAPARCLQEAALAAGAGQAACNFAHDGYVLHLGAGTSRGLLRLGRSDNPYVPETPGPVDASGALVYDFDGTVDGMDRYVPFLARYDAEAAALEPAAFADLLTAHRARWSVTDPPPGFTLAAPLDATG